MFNDFVVRRTLLGLCSEALGGAHCELNEFDRWADLVQLASSEGVLSALYEALRGRLDQSHPAVGLARDKMLGQALGALQLAPRCGEVVSLLNDSGIRVLAYKGLVLSSQMYGGICVRPGGDFDILVDPADALDAYSLLEANGFVSGLKRSQGQIKALIRYGEGCSLSSVSVGLTVDLHWTLFDRWIDLPLSFDFLWGRREELSWIGGATMSTLGRDDTALLLCLHGCQHGFERLKWLVDLSKARSSASRVDWKRVSQLAGHRAPMVELALLSVEKSLQLRSPVPASSGVKRLARSWLDVSEGKAVLLDSDIERNLSAGLTLRSGLSRLSGLCRAFLRPSLEDIHRISFPERFLGAYRVIRVLQLCRKFFRRSLAKVVGSGKV